MRKLSPTQIKLLLAIEAGGVWIVWLPGAARNRVRGSNIKPGDFSIASYESLVIKSLIYGSIGGQPLKLTEAGRDYLNALEGAGSQGEPK